MSVAIVAFFALLSLSIKKTIYHEYINDKFIEFASSFVHATDVVMVAGVIGFIIIEHKYIKVSNRIFYTLYILRKIVMNAIKIVPRGTIYSIFTKNKLKILVVTFLIVGLTSHKYYSDQFSIYKYVHFVLVSTFFTVVYRYFTNHATRIYNNTYKIVPRGTILYVALTVVITGVINSVIGIAQFVQQKSIGFVLLRESSVSIDIAGSSKAVVFDNIFMRAYGLLPHPNVLAGFLVFTITTTIALIIVPRGTI